VSGEFSLYALSTKLVTRYSLLITSHQRVGIFYENFNLRKNYDCDFLLLMLDFQVTRTADIPNGDFRTTEIKEPAQSGCAINPNETRSDGLLTEPFISVPDDEPVRWETPQASVSTQNATEMRIQRMAFPPVAPPEPPRSPVATPEPPTIAILTLIALALLLLLFGRRIRCRR
jgi:hypothetical protein